ncbi:hypothetical protein GF312_12420 [Candidatus Poribacteria bacterium]|nr:hypothetical protein [Candidatus Poribacteria bacterium]
MMFPAYIAILGIIANVRADANMANPIRLSSDGWFRYENNKHYIPLGGFHGNVIPISLLNLTEEEKKHFEPRLWNGHIDLYDATEKVLHQWFSFLQENGVTSLRLFPRANVGVDVLDLCGKVNMELWEAFHRAFTTAADYDIRFLLQIMPEPGRTGYLNKDALKKHVLPKFTDEDKKELTPSQKHFILEKDTVSMRKYFTDPDVLECHKLYLRRVLKLVADEPQIFALEIYNEQGWGGVKVNDKWEHSFNYFLENDEIQWSKEITEAIKQELPEMPVCLSHPGFGVTGFDPFRWSIGAGVDFYSQHLYAGLCGAEEDIDFSAVTAATSAIISAAIPNSPGEWGILDSKAPANIRHRGHRDAIWLNMLTGSNGFMQWEYDFPQEYKWVKKVYDSIPEGFKPDFSDHVSVEIVEEYKAFQTDTRYPMFSSEEWFNPWEFNRLKHKDENIRKIYAAYWKSLEDGVPIHFTMNGDDSILLEDFLSGKLSTEKAIEAEGGYQLSYLPLSNGDKRIYIAYLRSRKIENFSGHILGVPVKRSLDVIVNQPVSYTIQIIDLNTEDISVYTAAGKREFHLGDKSDHDFVLVISQE